MAKVQFSREKYEQRILNELNLFLRTNLKDPRLQFVSITKVELDRDYQHAKAYWDTFDPDIKSSAKEAFQGLGPKARQHLSSVMKVRQIPGVSFHYDGQYEGQAKIEKILACEKERSITENSSEDPLESSNKANDEE